MEKNNKLIAVLVAICAVFILGLFSGYLLWGKGGDVPDYRTSLKEITDYIVTLEHKNKKLLKELDAAESALATQEQPAVTIDPQVGMLQSRLETLQRENARISAELQRLKAPAPVVTPLPETSVQ